MKGATRGMGKLKPSPIFFFFLSIILLAFVFIYPPPLNTKGKKKKANDNDIYILPCSSSSSSRVPGQKYPILAEVLHKRMRQRNNAGFWNVSTVSFYFIYFLILIFFFFPCIYMISLWRRKIRQDKDRVE